MNSPSEIVQVLLSYYKRTSNPLFAWECYQAARTAGVPIPDEILNYLDGAAREILIIAKAPPEAKRVPDALFRGMGFSSDAPGRGGSAFARFARNRFSFGIDKIAIEALVEIERWGEGHEHDVYRAVGEKYKVSASTVRRKYKDFLKRVIFD